MPYKNLDRRRELSRDRERLRRVKQREANQILGKLESGRFASFMQRALKDLPKKERWADRLAEVMGEGAEYDRLFQRYLSGEVAPLATNAYRIGEAFRQLGVGWSSGPAALYCAGHIAKLIRFFAELAEVNSARRTLGRGAERVALLYCNLWAVGDDTPPLRAAKYSEDIVSTYDRARVAALKRLNAGATADGVAALYEKAWQAACSRHRALHPIVALAQRNAEALGSRSIDGSWTVLRPWVATIASRAYEVYRNSLGAREYARLLVEFPAMPYVTCG